MSEEMHPTVSVIGSLNIDYFTKVDCLPSPGETVASLGLELFRGGKGANQAISASRQGARVRFFGCVGSDTEGDEYRRALDEEGIDLTFLGTSPSRTGSAFITVDQGGENMIVVASGANEELTGADILEGSTAIRESRAILANFEVPVPAVIEAARIANAAGIPVVINPSPIDPLFPWHEIQTDYLIVNEGEATEVLEFPPFLEELSTVRQRLTEMRIEHLVITRGGKDTVVFVRGGETFSVETLPVLPIDTVGAGDAFAGCLTARIAAGEPLEAAVRAANCAGALTTLGSGAQAPVPDREKVEQHLDHLNSHV